MKELLAAIAALTAFAIGLPAWGANPIVEVKTTEGVITVELYSDKAPKTVDNFLKYVKDGFYNGTVFHRVIDGFMIQGGGFDLGMNQKTTRAPVESEAKNGLKNQIGTLAMARTDNQHLPIFRWLGLCRLRQGHAGHGRRKQDFQGAHRQRHGP